MSKAFVLIVIPTTGRASVRRAVTSALNQHSSQRIVVVLDAPDNMPSLLEGLHDLEVDIVLTPGGVGGAEARNIGSRHQDSDYIAYLDDDDWWEQGYIAGQLAAISAAKRSRPENAVFGSALFHRAGNTPVAVPRVLMREGEDVAVYAARRRRVRFGETFAQTSTIVVSRSAFELCPWPADMRKHQDWEWLARLQDHSQIELTQSAIGRVHVEQGAPGSVSKTADWDASYSWWKRRLSSTGSRESGDFVATILLRTAIRRRQWPLIAKSALLAIRHKSHAAPVLIALAEFLR